MSKDGSALVFTNTKDCNSPKPQLFVNIFWYETVFLHNINSFPVKTFAYASLVNSKPWMYKVAFLSDSWKYRTLLYTQQQSEKKMNYPWSTTIYKFCSFHFFFRKKKKKREESIASQHNVRNQTETMTSEQNKQITDLPHYPLHVCSLQSKFKD